MDSISEVSLSQTRDLGYEIQKKHLLHAWTQGLNQLNVPLSARELNSNHQTQSSDLIHQLSTLIEYYKSGSNGTSERHKRDKSKLSDLYQQWLSERLKEKTWTEKTAEDIERKFRLFFGWVSPSVTVMDFNHNKAIGIKTKLLDKGLAVLTLNKYLQTYSSFFRWLKTHGYLQINPFEGIALKEHRRAQDQRKAFPVACIGSVIDKCAEVGSATYGKEYYKYVPLIAAHSGMRLNEICQLYKRDIQLIDNQWCFTITDDSVGQRLKTPSSKRLVPMHNEIIQSGFFNYIDGNSSDRCFPELTHSRDGYGKNASRWFNERLMKRYFPELDCVFHSFRHAVADVMMKSDVDKGIAKAILGHADDSETFGRYGKGYSVNQLKRAIDSIQYQK
ncbi:tyrosine-type recombinase/integrase [Vibrio atlanticus]|nr:tyrosine-type recombinase/integrase [Vibrio atlanticus]